MALSRVFLISFNLLLAASSLVGISQAAHAAGGDSSGGASLIRDDQGNLIPADLYFQRRDYKLPAYYIRPADIKKEFPAAFAELELIVRLIGYRNGNKPLLKTALKDYEIYYTQKPSADDTLMLVSDKAQVQVSYTYSFSQVSADFSGTRLRRVIEITRTFKELQARTQALILLHEILHHEFQGGHETISPFIKSLATMLKVRDRQNKGDLNAISSAELEASKVLQRLIRLDVCTDVFADQRTSAEYARMMQRCVSDFAVDTRGGGILWQSFKEEEANSVGELKSTNVVGAFSYIGGRVEEMISMNGNVFLDTAILNPRFSASCSENRFNNSIFMGEVRCTSKGASVINARMGQDLLFHLDQSDIELIDLRGIVDNGQNRDSSVRLEAKTSASFSGTNPFYSLQLASGADYFGGETLDYSDSAVIQDVIVGLSKEEGGVSAWDLSSGTRLASDSISWMMALPAGVEGKGTVRRLHQVGDDVWVKICTPQGRSYFDGCYLMYYPKGSTRATLVLSNFQDVSRFPVVLGSRVLIRRNEGIDVRHYPKNNQPLDLKGVFYSIPERLMMGNASLIIEANETTLVTAGRRSGFSYEVTFWNPTTLQKTFERTITQDEFSELLGTERDRGVRPYRVHNGILYYAGRSIRNGLQESLVIHRKDLRTGMEEEKWMIPMDASVYSDPSASALVSNLQFTKESIVLTARATNGYLFEGHRLIFLDGRSGHVQGIWDVPAPLQMSANPEVVDQIVRGDRMILIRGSGHVIEGRAWSN